MSIDSKTALSSSPKSLVSFFGDEGRNRPNKSLGLTDFLVELPQTIESILDTHDSLKPQHDDSDPIAELFR